MKLITFKNVQEFIDFRRHCLMCGEPLTPAVTNFTTISGGKPSIKSNYIKNSFDFRIDYNGSSLSVSCSVSIDCINDTVKFTNEECWLIDPQDNNMTAFDLIDLHIESYCDNKSCTYSYYVSSDLLKIDENGCKLKPVKLYCESFKIGKLTVFNDYSSGETNIFSNKKGDASLIKVAMLDFQGLNRDKIINKVKTVVNFS